MPKGRCLLGLVFVLLSTLSVAQEWDEGLHYDVLDDPVYVGSPERPEVVEYFYYGCPHCYSLEPFVKVWLKRKPANVDFYWLPATFDSGRWDWSAKLFYTARALKVFHPMHDRLFDAIHAPGAKGLRSTRDMARLFQRAAGVTVKDFEKTFNGFTVRSEVERARAISKASGITGVPAVIVNGKYLISLTTAGGGARLFKLVDWLLENNP